MFNKEIKGQNKKRKSEKVTPNSGVTSYPLLTELIKIDPSGTLVIIQQQPMHLIPLCVSCFKPCPGVGVTVLFLQFDVSLFYSYRYIVYCNIYSWSLYNHLKITFAFVALLLLCYNIGTVFCL